MENLQEILNQGKNNGKFQDGWSPAPPRPTYFFKSKKYLLLGLFLLALVVGSGIWAVYSNLKIQSINQLPKISFNDQSFSPYAAERQNYENFLNKYDPMLSSGSGETKISASTTTQTIAVPLGLKNLVLPKAFDISAGESVVSLGTQVELVYKINGQFEATRQQLISLIKPQGQIKSAAWDPSKEFMLISFSNTFGLNILTMFNNGNYLVIENKYIK